MRCWGRNNFGESDAPSGRFTQVSTGEGHTCGLTTAGEVRCWGRNNFGESDAPSGRFTQVSTGGGYTCALTTVGEVRCWGSNDHGEADPPAGQFIQVSASNGSVLVGIARGYDRIEVGSRNHTCALRQSGEVVCWGANDRGQANVPSGRFTQVSTRGGENHCYVGDCYAIGPRTCALTKEGEVRCWGGFNETDAPSEHFTQIDSGRTNTCALTEEGEVRCWGGYGYEGPIRLLPSLASVDTHGPAATAIVSAGRIVARRLADGRTEFGWQPAEGGQRVLPRSRYFPANAQADRWLRSSPIEVDGVELGRINARLLADGRIEFAFTPSGGERILPQSRYFPVGAVVDRWLRSTVIDLGE